jgi:hypothetical protein
MGLQSRWFFFGVLASALVVLLLALVAEPLLLLLPPDEIDTKMSVAAPLRRLTSSLSLRVPRIFAGQHKELGYKSFASTLSSTLPVTVTTAAPSLRTFTSSTSSRSNSNMAFDSTNFKDAAIARRSIYQLNKTSPIDEKKLEEILQSAIKHVPSSFNSQSARLVVLLKDEHDKFWDMVTGILKAHVPEDKWEHTGQRMNGFRNAYGTVSSIR